MIYHIPLESYPTRYTADWQKQFEREFEEHVVKYATIKGDSIGGEVTDGAVLNALGTSYYKNSQMAKIINLFRGNWIVDNDVFFFADLWFPGIEHLFYLRNLLKINFKVVGIMHAGTYDCHDFTVRNGMKDWGQWFESMLFTEVDKIFVATNYHKNLIHNYSTFEWTYNNMDKVIVTGLPFYSDAILHKYPHSPKEKIVLFTHRNDPEKHPERFKVLKNIYQDEEWKFIKTLDVCKTRDDYFHLLGKSAIVVSFAEQETFGYSMLEAMALGCQVFAPDRLSYTETMNKESLYSSDFELLTKINNEMEIFKPDSFYIFDCNIQKWKKSIGNMLDCVETLIKEDK